MRKSESVAKIYLLGPIDYRNSSCAKLKFCNPVLWSSQKIILTKKLLKWFIWPHRGTWFLSSEPHTYEEKLHHTWSKIYAKRHTCFLSSSSTSFSSTVSVHLPLFFFYAIVCYKLNILTNYICFKIFILKSLINRRMPPGTGAAQRG